MHDFEVIEIAGQTALFTNDRLMPADIPKGTYCYGLRQSDDSERFCTIEKNVTVNHGGTVITKELKLSITLDTLTARILKLSSDSQSRIEPVPLYSWWNTTDRRADSAVAPVAHEISPDHRF